MQVPGGFLEQLPQFRAQVQATRDLQEDLTQKIEKERIFFNQLHEVQRVLRLISEKISEPSGVITTQLITTALQGTFPDEDLALDLEHSVFKGKPAIEVRIHDRRRGVIDDPMEASGGGPRALIGILLRVLTIVRQPHLARILILDEPFQGQVSRRYQGKAARLLRQLCEPLEKGGLGFTMLVVTHDESLKKVAHRSYQGVVGEDGVSLKLIPYIKDSFIHETEIESEDI